MRQNEPQMHDQLRDLALVEPQRPKTWTAWESSPKKYVGNQCKKNGES